MIGARHLSCGKNPFRRLTPNWLILIGVIMLCANAEAGQLMAGAAEREITPSVRTPLAGYSRRHGTLSTGVHDPVFVRAVVLQDGERSVALVSADLLIIDERLFNAVRHRVEIAPRAVPMTILLAATHTHSGPGAYGRKLLEKISMGHYDPRVFDELAARIAEAILSASDTLKPVGVHYAVGPTVGAVHNRMTDDGVVDAELSVVAFEAIDHQPVAIVANFAAHPTTLGSRNMAVSADYPGVLVQRLHAAHPSAVALFFPGAVGDQGPVKQGEGFEPAKRLGEALAQDAEALLARSTADADGGLQIRQRVVPLAPAQVRLGGWTLPRFLGQSLVDDDATLTVAAVGPVLFMGVPCDLSAELGLELKRHATARGFQPVVVGFADDYVGYCLPSRVYDAKHYEASMAFNGPGTGEQLVEELKKMIDELASSQ